MVLWLERDKLDLMNIENFAGRLIRFYRELDPNLKLTEGVSVINPFADERVWPAFEKFCNKYYSSRTERIIILGINPGRFGAGLTGIPFTDPYHLDAECGIKNEFDKRKELSSIVIHDLINLMGGAHEFYDKFYISSVSPFGFLKDGKNYNYYDDPELFDNLKEFIVASIEKQMDLPCSDQIAFSLGRGKNYKYLSELNDEYKWFKKVIALAHPRWMIQYQRKNYDKLLSEMAQILAKA